MKSKKLISFLCAAAMTVSSFAGLAVTANAATDVLTVTDGTGRFGQAVAADATTNPNNYWKPGNSAWKMKVAKEDGSEDEYLHFYMDASSTGSRSGSITLSETSSLTDNYVVEFDAYVHGGNGMGRNHSSNIVFNSASGEVIKLDLRAPLKNTGLTFGTSSANFPARSTDVNDGGTGDPSEEERAAAVAGTNDKWLRVQAAVSGTTVTYNAIDAGGNQLVTNKTDTLSAAPGALTQLSIGLCRDDGKSETAHGYVFLDNLHVYAGSAEALTATGLRGNVEIVEVTPHPVPEVKTAAPYLTAPSSATSKLEQRFSGAFTGITMNTTEVQTSEALTGLKAQVGFRASAADSASGISTGTWAQKDKVLQIVSGQYAFGHEGSGDGDKPRAPIVYITSDATRGAEEDTTVTTFDVMLNSTVAGKDGALYILGTDRNNNGGYNAVMAVLSTAADADSIVEESTANKIGIHVEPYTWYRVAVAVDNNKYRVWAAKENEAFTTSAQIDRTNVGHGDGSIAASSLGAVAAFTTTSSQNASTFSTARIDNLLVYTGTAGSVGPRTLLPSIGTAPVELHNVAITQDDENAQKFTITDTDEDNDEVYDIVVIHASYNGTTLADVEITEIEDFDGDEEVTFTNDVEANDKIFVWSAAGSAVPYCTAISIPALQ